MPTFSLELLCQQKNVGVLLPSYGSFSQCIVNRLPPFCLNDNFTKLMCSTKCSTFTLKSDFLLLKQTCMFFCPPSVLMTSNENKTPLRLSCKLVKTSYPRKCGMRCTYSIGKPINLNLVFVWGFFFLEKRESINN